MANIPIDEELLALSKFPDDNPNPVFRVSKDGTILYANSASIRLLYAWDVEIDQPLPDHLKPALKEVFDTGYPKEIEIENQGRIFLFTLVPPAGRDYIYLYAQDITERKRLDQLKDDFVSTISHELRIPLTIVKGAIQNLKEGIGGGLTDQQKEFVEIASRNLSRLQHLITELLELARLESGKMKHQREKLDPFRLLQEALHNFEGPAKQRNLELKIAPLRGRKIWVEADPESIGRVLNNLLDNALRFAKKKIVLSVEATAGHARLSVQDDGPGIPQAEQKNLFSKFYQVGRTKGGKEYKGTGLGLAIVKEIVERHGGQIWVESKPGHGAHFYFTLSKVQSN